jgi:L-lactate dehydrogenase
MKVGIVGAGAVGSAAAYAMTLRGTATEVVLIDRDTERAAAEAEDIAHATPFANRVRVWAGGYDSLKGARVVVLAAGVNQQPGESRPALLERNAEVFRDIVPQVQEHTRDVTLVVATNPVDAMTVLAEQLAENGGARHGKVFGTGTMLDTARFREAVGREFGLDAQHVHGYVVGEHGDSEVLVWSGLTVGGRPADEMASVLGVRWNDEVRRGIEEDVVGAAQRIIAGKGATAYGVGAVLARAVEVVMRDQRSILTVTAFDPEHGCALALPHLVSGAGVVRQVGVGLSEDEQARLDRSAAILREHLSALSSV